MNEAGSPLLKICKDQVSLDPQHDRLCKRVFKKILDTVISEAKRVSPEFKEVYYGKYKGGSYFDGLQVKCKNNDFDVNILFKLPPTSWKLDNLCDDVRRPNFAHMTAKEQTSKAWQFLEGGNRKGQNVILPKKMKELLHRAMTKALTALGHKVEVGGVEYRVTPQDPNKTPVILKVEGPDPVKFTVDLVPAFELGMKHLSIDPELEMRVKNVMKFSGKTMTTFMAIALKASSDQFELDFHEVERALLDSRPEVVFKVIKLMKHLRNERGSNMLKLRSHLLKTVVMHRVLETDLAYWREDNIDTCFSDSVRSLAEKLRIGSVVDIFFPQFNMLDLIEEKTIPENCANFLDKALKEAKTPSELFLPQTHAQLKRSSTHPDSTRSESVLHVSQTKAEERDIKEMGSSQSQIVVRPTYYSTTSKPSDKSKTVINAKQPFCMTPTETSTAPSSPPQDLTSQVHLQAKHPEDPKLPSEKNLISHCLQKMVLDDNANFLGKTFKDVKTPSELVLPQTLSPLKCSAHLDSSSSGEVLHAKPPLAQEEEIKRMGDPSSQRVTSSANCSLIVKASGESKHPIDAVRPSHTQVEQDFDSKDAAKVEVEADAPGEMATDQPGEDFCQFCNKRVGKENWSSHTKGKDHCKKKRMSEDKEKLLHLVQPAKLRVASGIKRPNTKGQVQHTQEKKGKSKTTTPNLLSSSRVPPVHETVSFSSSTTNATSKSMDNVKRAEKVPTTVKEKELLSSSKTKITKTTGLTDKVKITWLPSSNPHGRVETTTGDAKQSRSASEIVVKEGSHQKVEEIRTQPDHKKAAEDLARSLKMYVKPPDGFEEGEEVDGKTELDSILEEIDSLADEESIPKERARALDQGLAEICTTAAVANSCVEDLHPEQDVNLNELIGALKQGEQVDIWNGNNVEDFDGVEVRNIMDQKSKAYGNVLIKTEKLTKENRNKNGELVLVYLRKENDPSTMHCVYLKRFHFCRNNTTLKEDLCEAINSWGDLHPKLYIPARQRGNRIYKVTTEWTQVGPIENLTSALPASATNTSASDCEPSFSQEIISESEQPNRCMIS